MFNMNPMNCPDK